ncbi:MAG: VCBS repeat-containing protein [Planctomycetota bacterium]
MMRQNRAVLAACGGAVSWMAVAQANGQVLLDDFQRPIIETGAFNAIVLPASVVDLNADGFDDVVLDRPPLLLASMDESGVPRFDGFNDFFSIGQLVSLRPADLDSDGDTDLFGLNITSGGTTLRVALNPGDAGFDSTSDAFTVSSDAFEIRAVDPNGDDAAEILVLEALPAGIRPSVWNNDGDAGFTGPIVFPVFEAPGLFEPSANDIDIVDLNNDGLDDVLYLDRPPRDPTPDGAVVFALISTGLGGYTPTSFGEIALEGQPPELVADLDGDGDPELVAFDEDGDVLFRRGDGEGGFEPRVERRRIDGLTNGSAAFLGEPRTRLLDLDGDSAAEAVTLVPATVVRPRNFLGDLPFTSVGPLDNPATLPFSNAEMAPCVLLSASSLSLKGLGGAQQAFTSLSGRGGAVQGVEQLVLVVHPNDGFGRFGAPRIACGDAIVNFSFSEQGELLAGDFDDDGATDVLAIEQQPSDPAISYWRNKAGDVTDAPFTMGAAGFVPVSPADGAVLTIDQDLSIGDTRVPGPIIQWEPAGGGGITYDLVIFEGSTDGPVAFTALDLPTPFALIPLGILAPNETYQWTVTATNDLGTLELRGSTPTFFTGQFDSGCPGDADNDSDVDRDDFVSVLVNFEQPCP